MDLDLSQGAWRLAVAGLGAGVATLAVAIYVVVTVLARRRI